MYKIKHNEIKILQNLKGGSVFSSLGKSSSFKNHPLELEVYNETRLFNGTGANANRNYTFLLNLHKDIDFKLIRPLFGQEIRYEKFDLNMFIAIILTLRMFKVYETFLSTDEELQDFIDRGGVNADYLEYGLAGTLKIPFGKLIRPKETVPGNPGVADGDPGGPLAPVLDLAEMTESDADNLVTEDVLNEAKKIRKKLVELGIGVLKVLQLYDHYENKFIEYEDFKKNIGTPADTGDIDLIVGLEDNKSQKELAKSFVDNLVDIDETDVDDPVEIGALANSANDIDGVIKKIQKYIGLTEHGIEITNNTIGDIFNLKKFYNNIKYLYNRYYKEEINCKKIYFRQIFVNPPQPPNPYMLNRRWLLEGGNYDKLDYMLNGGSLNTIVRIPNLSEYFKSQLNIVENRLRVNNKALSEVSKREINQIIDALHEHEKNLKDQFELLKAAHLIDQKEISIKDDADKLKKAKSSLRKHIRYSGALVDIIRTVAETFKSQEDEQKSLFERLE